MGTHARTAPSTFFPRYTHPRASHLHMYTTGSSVPTQFFQACRSFIWPVPHSSFMGWGKRTNTHTNTTRRLTDVQHGEDEVSQSKRQHQVLVNKLQKDLMVFYGRKTEEEEPNALLLEQVNQSQLIEQQATRTSAKARRTTKEVHQNDDATDQQASSNCSKRTHPLSHSGCPRAVQELQ